MSTTTYWCLFCLASTSHFLVWWVLSLTGACFVWWVSLIVFLPGEYYHLSGKYCYLFLVWWVVTILVRWVLLFSYSMRSTVTCFLIWVLSLFLSGEYHKFFLFWWVPSLVFFSWDYLLLVFLSDEHCLFSCLVIIVACFLIRWVLPLVCRLVSQISLSSTCKVLPTNIIAVCLVSSNN